MQRIEEEAEVVERAYQKFHEMQTEYGMDAREFSDQKRVLRDKLTKLKGELDVYLAKEYGVAPGKSKDFDTWRTNHQPFHWFAEFYRIMNRRGFDVIIGNPPYIEYNKIKGEYTIRGYETEQCGNLYAFIVERALSLLYPQGMFGMILPMSLVSTARVESLRRVLKQGMSRIYYSNYSGNRNPSVLFNGVEMRLTIVVGKRSGGDISIESHVYTSGFLRWYTEARDVLFPLISYVQAPHNLSSNGLVPKLDDPTTVKILSKLFNSKQTIGNRECIRGRYQTYAHRIASYFVKCLDFVPHFQNDRDGLKKSEDYKVFTFPSRNEASMACSIINSNLFYLYFITYADAYHCGRELLLNFPFNFSRVTERNGRLLIEASQKLMRDYQKNAVRRRIEYKGTGWVELDKYFPKRSKAILNEIDEILANHYGFTDEELDSIINYDIKYRMGASDAEDYDGASRTEKGG